MKKLKSRLLTGAAAAAIAMTMMPVMATSDITAEAAEATGSPYNAEGVYDVTVPHVTVSQVYGGSDDGAASHSFIELYNQTGNEIDLSGWYVACRSSEDGKDAGWSLLELTGKIEAGGYYLIRCGETGGTDYSVPAGDQEWDMLLHNKGISVAVFSSRPSLDESFAGDVTEDGVRPEGYVDMLAVQGNDETDAQAPPAWETSYVPEQSKKKAVRRTADDSGAIIDTDDNKDVEVIDYSGVLEDPDKGPHGPEGTGDQEGGQDETVGNTYRNDSFETEADITLSRTGDITLGKADPDGGVAEIVAYNPDNGKAYVVNGQDGLLNIVPVNADGTVGPAESSVKAADIIKEEMFEYGDMTSVAVDTVNKRVVVAIQEADYRQTGRAAVLDYEGNVTATYETGVQPDMITVSSDGRYILTADEGEPREGYGAGSEDPAGTVTVIDTKEGRASKAGFDGFDAESLEKGILLNKVNGKILDPAFDFEPEYIGISPDGKTAYVALQEANAIAELDIGNAAFTCVKSLGFQDYSEVKTDLKEDGKYEAANYENAFGVRMPDGISVFEAGGTTYIATANEGDAREWGDFVNETKADIGDAEKVRVLDHNVTAGIDEGVDYLYGSRSFSIFDAGTMELVYDSGSDFEEKTAAYLPVWFNCSNDDTDVDSRSAKKGPEPEAVMVKRLGERSYAFIALERIGGIMVYDVTDPSEASYVNYINTRDFSDTVNGDVAPEGMAFAGAAQNPSGDHILLAACEVSGTVAAYTLDGPAADAPLTESTGSSQGADSGQGSVNDNRESAVSDGTARTGDGSGAAVIAALMLLAAAGIAGTVIYETRKNTY